MPARQARRSAGVLARLAARLLEKNQVQPVAGRFSVPGHSPVVAPEQRLGFSQRL